MSAISGADSSRDYYRLTYADPTGEAAVRNLMGRTVQISWENGAAIHLDLEEIRPFLSRLEYRMSRKGHIWGKRKSPAATGDKNQNPTITKENRS